MAIPQPVPLPNDQISTLRQELKAWEKEFVAANGGRKAGRDDIKKDAVIGTCICMQSNSGPSES